jgi:hypothetical protein
MMRCWPSLIGALAMMVPMPSMAAGGDALVVRVCGDPSARLVIPMKQDAPEPDQPCSKACHIGGCRRRT